MVIYNVRYIKTTKHFTSLLAEVRFCVVHLKMDPQHTI